MRMLPAIAAVAIVVACQDPGSESGPTAAEREQLLYLVSGDEQVAVAGEPLDEPLVVEVRDVWGNAIAGVRVTWSVVSGLGAFNTPSLTVTGADGRTMASFTPSTARVGLRAAIESRLGSNVLFRVVPRQTAVYDRLSPTSGCSPAGCDSFVFYADYSFALRYAKVPDYFGMYSRNGSVLEMVFEEEDWRATATIRGDTLTVRYNANASLSDFEDGIFLLKEGSPVLP